ncbi:MAG: hypothetical protein AB1778_03040 [Candidatus Bipolaricaulota bacterium]
MGRWVKAAAVVALLGGWAWGARAVPLGLADVWAGGPSGQTVLCWAIDAGEWEGVVSRSVSHRFDVAGIARSAGRPVLRLRAVVADLWPFVVAAEWAGGRIAAQGALHLGPVLLVAERSILPWETTRWTVGLAVSPRVALSLQAVRTIAGLRAAACFAAVVGDAPRRTASAAWGHDGLRLTVGVAW